MSLYPQIKQFLLGKSLPTSAHSEERLSNAAALAVLSSDALSSVAYATEEILLVLVAAGSGALGLSLPIAIAIILLLCIVVLSYRQTIRAYPQGGGSYIVARENLGLYPGLVAGGSLMIDYILTVTVSISAGTAALTSAVPALRPFTVSLCLIFIFLLTLANLRGVKESGRIFMIPTYGFIVSIFVLIAIGLFKQVTGQAIAEYPPIPVQEGLSLFFILRAFSAGCTALTGVEAISDGVLAFKEPEWKNARITLLYLGGILGLMFIGITYLSNVYHVVPEEGQTVVSLLGREILGNNAFYYFVQIVTLLVLLLAANTSYADFPRLCYFLARDGFLPRQLALLGDRLVYSNGIILLSLCAGILVIIFKGQVNAVIPLYAVGVFTSFTLSQAGMVRHWFQSREPNWRASAFMNGLGAIATLVVLIVIVSTKFLLGAWLVVVAIPVVVALFSSIHRHYQYVAERLSIQGIAPRSYIPRPKPEVVTHPAVVVVGHLNRGTVEALDYARTIADEIVAVHVDINGSTDREKLQEKWRQLESDIPLEIIDSPYRSVITPIVDFVAQFEERHPDVFTTIVIPAFVTRNWWDSILHNQTTLFLKTALRAKKSRVISTVRYYL
ncbi:MULTISPECIES: APC family permease [unclassified Tolypothrix]|uniref:APC family permease n=1 Tax=unclassified Tolypothrix TaxID=2649714 RepID=UPI0005EAA58B|nr:MULTISPECIES: APC family permease [unclassified Tolypothrix]BAY90439.1 amino acid permease-associated region [Microchaete diplosiphon NIES-3275]EKF01019.1 amino acid permease [Tolypothrix sp. PCC 7601]MBE9085289.1 APC family permease [Tolypothrix sp. LEGE 11397]UYD24608.1 APC family permease [Tolypothrix sp. PCC 7712]UYD33162.1 APC family permease [Tolypothrix sp. PCC 7601]